MRQHSLLTNTNTHTCMYANTVKKRITYSIVNIQFFDGVFIIGDFKKLIQINVVQALFTALRLEISATNQLKSN